MMAAPLGNKYAVGNKGGRPLKFQSVEKLQAEIDDFFNSCYEVDIDTGRKIQVEPFTITGLALALDTSREVLMDIENLVSEGYTREFSDCVVRAKLKCHNYAEKQLYTAKSPQGAIFALKNYGWKDVQTVEQTGPNGGPILLESVNTLSDTDLQKVIDIMEQGQLNGEIMDIESK